MNRLEILGKLLETTFAFVFSVFVYLFLLNGSKFYFTSLEQMVHFPTREKNILDLILTTLPSQFQDAHSPDKLSDHDIVSGTCKNFIPSIKKPRRKVYLYQKGDYESMRKDTHDFAKENTSMVTRILVQYRRTLI